MSEVGVFKQKLNEKLKFTVGRGKTSSTRGNEGTKKWKNSKYETNRAVSDHDMYSEKRSFRSSSKDTRFRSSKEGFDGDGDRKREFRSENSGFKRKRVYADRDVGQEVKYRNAGVPYWKSFSRERENDRDGFVRGRERDGLFRGRERGNDREGSFRGRDREVSFRGRERWNDRDGGERRNDRDGSFSGRERRNNRDDYVRGSERRNDRDPSVGGRERRNDRDESVGGKRNEFSQEKSGRDEFTPSRADRGNEDSKINGKHSSHRVEGNARSDEMSGNKLRSIEKASTRRGAVKVEGGEDALLKKSLRNKTDSTKQVDQKHNEKQESGTLKNAAKKLLRHRKDLAERAVMKDGVRKKKKQDIRIDPHDISNKRLDDGISIDGNVVEKKVDLEEDVEISKNAQFRAIQPSPSILSFVEDNLLGRRRLIELKRSGYNIELSAPLDNVPFSPSSERERIEEPAFRNRLEFCAAAKVSSSFPPPELPEIAFAGRSNVGKSSLLNALTRQWGVVRTSDKPGLTQTINFFKLGPKVSLVDLPGYGFAYAKEEVKDAWEELVKEYVSTRVGLRRVCLLIDTKWGMKPRDHELIDLMERSQTNYQIVLTKTDAVFPIDVARRAMQIEENLNAKRSLVEPVMMVSSKTGAGIRSLRTVLSKISRFAKL